MRDVIYEIWESIRRNKLRTALTGFAVAWGIFMIIVLLGAGNGVMNAMMEANSGIDINTMSLYGGVTTSAYGGFREGRQIELDIKDLDVLRSDAFKDVIDEISQKMIRRHPHVFGSVQAETSDQVLVNWEEIKKKEKEGKSWIKSPLREIPQELPALARACKVIKKADKLYGDKETVPEAETILDDMETSISRLRTALESNDGEQLKETFSRMLWQTAQLAYREKLSPEQLLTDKIADKIEFFEPEGE